MILGGKEKMKEQNDDECKDNAYEEDLNWKRLDKGWFVL